MSDSNDNNLLSRLARGEQSAEEAGRLAATKPEHDAPEEAENATAVKVDGNLDAILDRLNNLADDEPDGSQEADGPAEIGRAAEDTNAFLPIEPESFRQAKLTDTEVEALAIKYLLSRGDVTGRNIAGQLRLPFVLVDELMRGLKNDQLGNRHFVLDNKKAKASQIMLAVA